MRLEELNAEITNIRELKHLLTSGMVKLAKVHACIKEIEEQVDKGVVDTKKIKGKLKKIEKEVGDL